MRIFYTGSDIEDLAANGIRQINVGPDITLTDAARERAEDLGIALVTPVNAPTSKTKELAVPAKVESLPSRPRGCQHGSLPSTLPSNGNQTKVVGGRGPVVDRLVEAVSALTKRGG